MNLLFYNKSLKVYICINIYISIYNVCVYICIYTYFSPICIGSPNSSLNYPPFWLTIPFLNKNFCQIETYEYQKGPHLYKVFVNGTKGFSRYWNPSLFPHLVSSWFLLIYCQNSFWNVSVMILHFSTTAKILKNHKSTFCIHGFVNSEYFM